MLNISNCLVNVHGALFAIDELYGSVWVNTQYVTGLPVNVELIVSSIDKYRIISFVYGLLWFISFKHHI